MTISRSIKQRLVEGLVRDLIADTDVAAKCADDADPPVPRIKPGPWLPGQSAIVPYQLHVSNSFDTTDNPSGVSGISEPFLGIGLTMYAPFDRQNVAIGGVNDVSFLEHIIYNVLYRGVPNNHGDFLGRIDDPDNPGKSLTTQLMYATIRPPTILTDENRKPLYLEWNVEARYQTQVSQTGARIPAPIE